MMSQVIRQETEVFLIAVCHGAMLALFYDVLRALRGVVPHGFAAVSAEDFLFWILAGFLTFCLLFAWTDGEIRGYVAAGIALGAALYLQLCSRLALAALGAVFRRLCGLLRLVWRILSFPVRMVKKGTAAFVRWGRSRKKTAVETVRKRKKRIEFPVERVYNKGKHAEKNRKKAGRYLHREHRRGSLDESGQKE